MKIFLLALLSVVVGNVWGQNQTYNAGTTVYEFTANGNLTGVPAGTSMTIEGIGGGGGGGGGYNGGRGGGGGGGAYTSVNYTSVGSPITVEIGADGAFGNPFAASENGGNGGNTIVKIGATTLCTANGGEGGKGRSGAGNANAGVGGAASSTGISYKGGDGAKTSNWTGGGGGGGSWQAAGNNASGQTEGAAKNTLGGKGGKGGQTISPYSGDNGGTYGGGGGGAGNTSGANSSGGKGAKGYVRITIIPPSCTTPTTQAVNGGDSYCSGGSGVAVGLASSQSGATYELYRGGTAIGVTITGTGSAINFPNQTTAGTYTVKVRETGGFCAADMSGSAVVTINPTSVGGSITGGSTPICLGSATGTMALSGHTGAIVRWQKRVNGGAWTNIAHTATTYSETPSSSGTWEYRAEIKSGVCDAVYSAVRTIEVNILGAPIVAGNITVGPVIDANGTPLLPDANITPVDYENHEGYRGRLFNMGPGTQGWASLSQSPYEWVVDLGSVKPINGVITQGRGDCCDQWTTQYEVQISQNGTNWVSMGLFNGNTDKTTPVTNMFASATTTARYVKVIPRQVEGWHTMRIDVISIPSACPSGTQAVSMSGEPASGANTLRWYSAASGGTPLHTGQYYTANISSSTNFYAASYNSVTGCESTARTLVTARIGVSEGTPPAATASIPTHVTNFSSTTPATGWTTSHGMAGHLPVATTNTSTHDCSGDAAPMNERGHYIWTRYNSNANRLSYTLKLNPGSVPDPHRTLLIEESVDGCVWTPVVIHTNTALLTNNIIQSFVQNLNPSSRHVRFNLTRRDINAGKIEVDNVMIYNNTPSFPTALSGNKNQTCQVYGQHWVDFFADDNTYIGSVRANGTTPTSNSLGNVTLTSFTGAPGTAPVCGETTNIIYQTAYLGRNWVITSTIAPTVDVSVRMPFYDSELGALSNTATTVTTGNPDDDVSVRTDLMLTKYSGTNEDNILTNNVCTPGAYAIYDTQEGDGLVNSIFTAMGSNSQYVVFNIPSFSELWLHGSNATIPSPLPIILSDFSASCKNRTITWATASEQNSSHFVVEQSRNGHEWSAISTVEGAGTKKSMTNYEISDNLSASYYRLKQVDFDGKIEYFGPIHVDCGNSNAALTVYPNPNNGTFTVAINTPESLGETAVTIQDVSGKIVAVRDVNVLSGTNTVHFEGNGFVPGTYIVSVQGERTNTLMPVRLVVQ